jgi:electron transfer flavoprotein alpha subunit
MKPARRQIWVFGDHRNYFQNRVTLQLIARAGELAKKIDAGVAAVVFGHNTNQWEDLPDRSSPA